MSKGPPPNFQKELLAKLMKRRSGMTTREVSDFFGGTIQNADQTLARLTKKGLVTKKKEPRQCESANAGTYERMTMVYRAAEGASTKNV